ncbi:hypothetical protein CANCADRAFT_823 [Tortispora caseinolytica NRRL Y-17796]|uniref:Nucleolar protein 12 n=1 Tax=Tortispora caseinolytica NRRL Y-17796 TaxID=767744 RepID=A0A1E4TKF9_9ASCO|nr:hypothetical protein CANCADRAFT_823 [Tortispora caseinolytica NRRL Y-17796]
MKTSEVLNRGFKSYSKKKKLKESRVEEVVFDKKDRQKFLSSKMGKKNSSRDKKKEIELKKKKQQIERLRLNAKKDKLQFTGFVDVESDEPRIGHVETQIYEGNDGAHETAEVRIEYPE